MLHLADVLAHHDAGDHRGHQVEADDAAVDRPGEVSHEVLSTSFFVEAPFLSRLASALVATRPTRRGRETPARRPTRRRPPAPRLAQRALLNANRPRPVLQHVRGRDPSDHFQQPIAALVGHQARQNHQLRIEQIHNCGGGNPQVAPRLIDNPPRQRIALLGRVADELKRFRRGSRLDCLGNGAAGAITARSGNPGDDCLRRGHGLQASSLAARARFSVRDRQAVPDLSRHSVAPRTTRPFRTVTAPMPASISKQTTLLHPLPAPYKYSPIAPPELFIIAGTPNLASMISLTGTLRQPRFAERIKRSRFGSTIPSTEMPTPSSFSRGTPAFLASDSTSAHAPRSAFADRYR